MASPKALKDKVFEKVINPYLAEVLQHPQSIKMSEEMLHIRDVEGRKKTGSMEMRLEAMEQQVFKCQGMVECGLNANHMMITEFTNKHKIYVNNIEKHLSRLYDRVDHLQAQIYDLQNQNYMASRSTYTLKSILGAGSRTTAAGNSVEQAAGARGHGGRGSGSRLVHGYSGSGHRGLAKEGER
ncbi:40s ribosomal protein s5-1 [Hordeum vulgare]|nr:40s ribosomal protein s5-1 [Hordeum vulgare]